MVVPLSLALMGLSGCNPYERWTGDEFNAGPVDAQTFPPEYLGAGANRQRAGSGSFTATSALAGGAEIEYFRFSFSSTQRTATNPLAVASSTAAPKAIAYVFDSGCQAPEGYSFDAVRDPVDYSQQGVIFTRLPSATYTPGTAVSWSYVPIVARVPVTSKGEGCQDIKSEAALVKRAGSEVEVTLTEPAPATGKQVGVSDGTLLAHAIIEPGAAVYHADGETPDTGVGLQKWGWYNQYLLAYLDGGVIPTQGGNMVPQRLYIPRSPVTVGGTDKTVAVGQGFDVLAARRGEAGYSPICEVWTYDAGGPLTPEQLPTSAADIEAQFGATAQRATSVPSFYCLQLQ
ncbi:hypothetical protein D187_009772 [Cystobacter fuscus DSM 2262]|uniref:Uncharacterized protein n=2 Tax=Cystobacter fuscus TaxID=43 RepID=S9QLW5_CYSF2|nr:hypothetical protein D187_009772 [Cystobacter fuscus DSM 2262]